MLIAKISPLTKNPLPVSYTNYQRQCKVSQVQYSYINTLSPRLNILKSGSSLIRYFSANLELNLNNRNLKKKNWIFTTDTTLVPRRRKTQLFPEAHSTPHRIQYIPARQSLFAQAHEMVYSQVLGHRALSLYRTPETQGILDWITSIPLLPRTLVWIKHTRTRAPASRSGARALATS